MEKLYFINGSPRGEKSVSKILIDELCTIIQKDSIEIKQISLNSIVNYGDIVMSDILIFIFPLYVDSLPSTVIEFLDKLEQHVKGSRKSTRVYCVVNCGFFEPIQTKHALSIIKNFCIKARYEWRFGVGVGAGPFMKETKTNIPLNSDIKRELYDAFVEIKRDISSRSKNNKENLFVTPKTSKSLYSSSGSNLWIEAAKRMSISKDKLYDKPLL